MEHLVLQTLHTADRCPNFSREEIKRLRDLIVKYEKIILCKKSDTVSSNLKEASWNRIEKEFNAHGTIHRTVKQLKNKFENLKRMAKKEISQHRQAVRGTGGGPPPPPISEESEWMRSKMPLSMEGHEAIYDDDVSSLPASQVLNLHTPIYVDTGSDRGILEFTDETIHTSGEKGCNSSSSTSVLLLNTVGEDQVGGCTSTVVSPNYEDVHNSGAPAGLLRKPISTPLKRPRQSNQGKFRHHLLELAKKKNEVVSKKQQCISMLEDIQKEESSLKIDFLKKSYDEKLLQEKFKTSAEKLKLEQEKIKLKLLELDLKKKEAEFKIGND